MSSRVRIICIVAVGSLLVLSLPAQDTVRVNVRLVNVTATVTDENGQYANNLTLEDFVLEEDGVPQKVTHFTQDRAVPVSVGILLDTSGSMLRRMQMATDAVERFVRTIHRDDDIFLMTFAARPVLRQDFTNDRGQLSRALRSLRLTDGKFDIFEVLTAIYDSLDAAVDKVLNGKHDKRAILLLTDGQDTVSKATAEAITRRLGRSEVLVYGLGVPPAVPPAVNGKPPEPPRPATPREAVNMNTLRQVANSSGGHAMLLSGDDPKQLDRVLSEIATELRNQYSLAYYPSIPEDGRFHKITVKVGNGYTIRARDGYFN